MFVSLILTFCRNFSWLRDISGLRGLSGLSFLLARVLTHDAKAADQKVQVDFS